MAGIRVRADVSTKRWPPENTQWPSASRRSGDGHIEVGHGLLMKRQFAEAAASANAALAAMKRATSGVGLAAVPFEGLQGEFYLRTGQSGKGRALLEGMAGEKARAAPGPDEWAEALFTLEAAARAAREVGDWEFAARMARQMLEHDSSYAGTHYALGLVAEHAGNHSAAALAFALAEEVLGPCRSGNARASGNSREDASVRPA